MNETVKNSLIFAAGGALGALVSTLILKRVYEQRFQAELDSIRAVFRHADEQEQEQPVEAVAEPVEVPETLTEDEVAEAVKLYEDTVKTNYNKMSGVNAIVSEDRPDVVEIITEGGVRLKISKAELDEMPPEVFEQLNGTHKRSEELPFLISRRELEETELGFTKSELTYYLADSVLADDDNDQLEFPELLIGAALLAALPHIQDFEESNTVFVRNERLQADYEVMIAHESYHEAILGWTGDSKGG